MTIRPAPNPAEADSLRVLKGRRLRRPTVAPWMIMALIGIIAFLGLGFARTSLDNAAFEMAELNKSISEQEAINRELNLEIASLENPARIAPLAEELGLVIPEQTNQILVDLEPAGPVVASAERQNQ